LAVDEDFPSREASLGFQGIRKRSTVLMISYNVKVIDITKDIFYEKYLYRCLAPMPIRRHRKRREYLQAVTEKNFHKKVVALNEAIVGQIEYAPAEASAYPIAGEGIVVMNCIWVLRRAKGHNLGRLLLDDMMRSEKNAHGFATIGLEGHWSGWMKKDHMKWLGFRSIDSIEVTHKTKHLGEHFKIHLMWLPGVNGAEPPKWNESRMLEGVSFCLAHPLYHPESLKAREILSKI